MTGSGRERVGLQKLDWAEGVQRSIDRLIFTHAETQQSFWRGKEEREGKGRHGNGTEGKRRSRLYSVYGDEQCNTAQ